MSLSSSAIHEAEYLTGAAMEGHLVGVTSESLNPWAILKSLAAIKFFGIKLPGYSYEPIHY